MPANAFKTQVVGETGSRKLRRLFACAFVHEGLAFVTIFLVGTHMSDFCSALPNRSGFLASRMSSYAKSKCQISSQQRDEFFTRAPFWLVKRKTWFECHFEFLHTARCPASSMMGLAARGNVKSSHDFD
jgi:hypothetical protein